MDRLSTLVLVAGLTLPAWACDGGGGGGGEGSAKPSRSRVNAVQAEAPAAVDLTEFCERYYEPDKAPALALPSLRAGSPAMPSKTRRWINVWATWCKPCIEELPRLTRWHQELQGRVDFDLVLLSADAESEAVQGFAKAHPEVEGTLQLEQADGLDPWVSGLGLPGKAVLPVHIFVDARDKVRCLRSAGIGEDDRAAVEQLLVSM